MLILIGDTCFRGLGGGCDCMNPSGYRCLSWGLNVKLGFIFVSVLSAIFYQQKIEAETNLQQGRYDEALEGYSRALEMAQKSQLLHEEIPKMLCNRSMVYYRMGKYEKAVEDSLTVTNKFPYFIKVCVIKGR